MLFRALVWAGMGLATGGEPTGWAEQALDGVIFVNVYEADPNVRLNQLLNEADDLRQINSEWERFWFDDQPSHLTPERVHGGIQ